MGRIQAAQLADQDTHRPAIGDDVVHVHQQHMRFCVLAQQLRFEQGPGLQIEHALAQRGAAGIHRRGAIGGCQR